MVLHPRAARHIDVFTQCSNCHTVFQLSAEVLRAAGGQVRCGRCGDIFNALARLAEDAGSFDNDESAFEMEERADSILETVVAEQVMQAAPDASEDEEEYGHIEIAQLQVLDFTDEDLIDETVEDTPVGAEPIVDASMEFTLPPGELDRIFIESKAGIVPPFPMSPSALPAAAAVEPLAATAQAAPPVVHAPVSPDDEEGPLPDIEVISDNRSYVVPPQMSPAGELPPVRFASWLAAAVLAALLLVGQMVHHNREALTAHGPFAPLLRALYSSIGAPLSSAPNLAVFQLRQWGVSGDAAADATLRVRASILNTSTQLQPFPLLRVTLANRYGTRIGAREFEPNEYLGKPIARLLSPGEKVDAILNILDPGKDAEGFEIDVCLRGGDKRIVCANDAAPPQARQ
jgi:predicted Zn finger-like uncharacterized protein